MHIWLKKCAEFYLFIDQSNKLKEASKWTVAENREGCPMKAKQSKAVETCGSVFECVGDPAQKSLANKMINN